MTHLQVVDSEPEIDRTPLTKEEQLELERCQKVITSGMETFIEVGEALREVRDRRLYRAEHSSFAAYLALHWGMSRRSAYTYIEAAEVKEALYPGGVQPDDPPLPSPRASRELGPLKGEPAEARAAWAEAVEEGGPRASAEVVKRAVARRRRPAVERRARSGLRRADETDRAILMSVYAKEGEDAARQRAKDMECGWPRDLRTPQLAGSRDVASAVREFLLSWQNETPPTDDDFFQALPEQLQVADRIMEPAAPGAALADRSVPIFEAVVDIDSFAEGEMYDSRGAMRAVSERLAGVLTADQPCVQRWIRRLRTNIAGAEAVLAGLLTTIDETRDSRS